MINSDFFRFFRSYVLTQDRFRLPLAQNTREIIHRPSRRQQGNRGRIAVWIFLPLFLLPALLEAQYLPSYLSISLSELETALGTVSGPVSFVPRPGSEQGTLEARLIENAGIVQTAGSPGNLSVVVLWFPIAKGAFAQQKSRAYLTAFVKLVASESAAILRWTEQVLERAVAENGVTPYLESQLLNNRQFKATYLPTLSPPMLSLTVTGGGEGDPDNR